MGYHVSVAVTRRALTRNEEVWVPAVLAAFCALTGANLIKNLILSIVGSGTVSPVRKAVEVLGTSYSSWVLMLFKIFIGEWYKPIEPEALKHISVELQDLGYTSPNWYVRQSRRSVRRSLSRGVNSTIVACATLLCLVLLFWEFFSSIRRRCAGGA